MCPILSTGATIVVQWEDDGPWTHVIIVGYGSSDHHGRHYKIQVTRTGCVIMRMKRHVNPMPILLNELRKAF